MKIRLFIVCLLVFLLSLVPPARLVLGQSVLVSDTFNRADTGSGLGVADSGQSWSLLAGTDGQILSNTAAFSALGRVAIDPGVSDYSACVTLLAANTRSFLMVHQVNSSAVTGISVHVEASTLYWSLFNNSTLVVNTGIVASAGDRPCIVVNGSLYELWVNGSFLASVSNGSHASDRLVSLGCYLACTGMSFDDFEVTSLVSPTPTPTPVPPTLTPTTIIVTATPIPPTITPTLSVETHLSNIQTSTENNFKWSLFAGTALLGVVVLLFVRIR